MALNSFRKRVIRTYMAADEEGLTFRQVDALFDRDPELFDEWCEVVHNEIDNRAGRPT